MRRGLKKFKYIVNPTLKLLFLTIIVVFYLFLGCDDSPPPIILTQVESVSIEGTLLLNEELIARVNPPESDVNYQWVRSRYKWGDYEEIPGAENQTYLVKEADQSYFIKVLVTGKGDSIGRAVSEPLNPTKEFDGDDPDDNPGDDQGGEPGDSPPILNIIEEVVITGNPVWNTELMAQVDPDGAEVDYQWYRSKVKLGEYKRIPEATESTYKIKKNHEVYFLSVLITGKGDTLGRSFSNEIGPVIEPNYYKLFVYMQALDIEAVESEKAVIIDDYVKV